MDATRPTNAHNTHSTKSEKKTRIPQCKWRMMFKKKKTKLKDRETKKRIGKGKKGTL